MATLSDVAQKAGVSITTAGKVFKGDSTVRSYLRERVQHAATDLGYHPNALARSLRQGAADLISLSVNGLANPFFGRLAELIARELFSTGYGSIVCHNLERVNEINRTACAAGTILVSPSPQYIEQVVQDGALVTIMALPARPDLAPNVAVDFHTTYRQLASLLWQTGRQRMAFCSPVGTWEHTMPYKFSVVEEYWQEIDGTSIPRCDEPEDLLELMTDKATAPQTVLCANDIIAEQVLAQLWQAGHDPINDILVVGCDGTRSHRGMWTVKVDIEQLAARAVELLRRSMAGDDLPREVTIATELSIQ